MVLASHKPQFSSLKWVTGFILLQCGQALCGGRLGKLENLACLLPFSVCLLSFWPVPEPWPPLAASSLSLFLHSTYRTPPTSTMLLRSCWIGVETLEPFSGPLSRALWDA